MNSTAGVMGAESFHPGDVALVHVNAGMVITDKGDEAFGIVEQVDGPGAPGMARLRCMQLQFGAILQIEAQRPGADHSRYRRFAHKQDLVDVDDEKLTTGLVRRGKKECIELRYSLRLSSPLRRGE